MYVVSMNPFSLRFFLPLVRCSRRDSQSTHKSSPGNPITAFISIDILMGNEV